MSESIIAYVTIFGDPSAGIRDLDIEVDTGFVEFLDDEDKEAVREAVKVCYETIHQERVRVMFDSDFPEEPEY